MKNSITQEHEYGCGVACFAFVNNITYKEAVRLLGRETSVLVGWRPSDLVYELEKQGRVYKNWYVRKKSDAFNLDGTIVLLERSNKYPFGHYLAFDQERWMDPWINLPSNNNLELAMSGFRDSLPGKAMYALIPE